MRDRDARNRVFTLGLPAERRQRRELWRDDHDTSLDLAGDRCHQSRVELLFTATRWSRSNGLIHLLAHSSMILRFETLGPSR